MRWLAILLLLPIAAAEPYFVAEDAIGDHQPFAPAKFDIVSIAASGDNDTLTVAMSYADDVRTQRGQHAVGLRGPGFHVHIACYIGQTTPASDDPQGCTVTDVCCQQEGQVADLKSPFHEQEPDFVDDGKTWQVTFDRHIPNILVGDWTERVYGQAKMSVKTANMESSPGAMGYSEADDFATEERFVLGEPIEIEAAERGDPQAIDKDLPAPGLAWLLAALILRRIR